MAQIEHLISNIMVSARQKLRNYLTLLPNEQSKRLDGIEALVTELVSRLETELFNDVFRWLSEQAEKVAGTCRICGRKCQLDIKNVRVQMKRCELTIRAVRYRCRRCGTNRSPIREWLGLQSGMTSAGLDRALTALSTKVSFGQTADQMKEQHEHEVDRTLVARRTYAIGQEALEYLAERRSLRIEEVMDSVGVKQGVDRVFVQTDGGSVPIGKLERPAPNETTERTPVRNLPKGKRPKTKREVRVCLAWEEGVIDNKVTDLHIAPHRHPEVSGERLYVAALEAGMGDNTHVHCTCDMGAWHVNQFEEQFAAQENRSLCADFYHTLEYISDAGQVFALKPDQRKQWIAIQASRLKAGQRDLIIADIKKHRCRDGGCVKTDGGECVTVAARRYLRNHGKHMDYPRFIQEELPIGSGEVEGRIRHLVRRRLDIPGDWREENLPFLMALISIRESGWWDEFWLWRDERDKARFRGRLQGIGLNQFRGTPPKKPPEYGTATERIDLDEFCAEFGAESLN